MYKWPPSSFRLNFVSFKFFFSWKGYIKLSFRGDTNYFTVYYNCYSDKFEEDKVYQVNCNSTNTEFTLKIPKEGTQKCIQVSYMIANLKTYIQHDYFIWMNFSRKNQMISPWHGQPHVMATENVLMALMKKAVKLLYGF